MLDVESEEDDEEEVLSELDPEQGRKVEPISALVDPFFQSPVTTKRKRKFYIQPIHCDRAHPL